MSSSPRLLQGAIALEEFFLYTTTIIVLSIACPHAIFRYFTYIL
ncbi:MAG: hypothetical protein ACI83D_000783 [Planctomycetota bacterium]|jgi:hypothetical protein